MKARIEATPDVTVVFDSDTSEMSLHVGTSPVNLGAVGAQRLSDVLEWCLLQIAGFDGAAEDIEAAAQDAIALLTRPEPNPFDMEDN